MKRTTKSKVLKGIHKQKDLKTNLRYFVLHLPFNMLFLDVGIFYKLYIKFTFTNMKSPLWSSFCRKSYTTWLLSDTSSFLWFSVSWSFEKSMLLMLDLLNDQSFLAFIKSADINCILIDWLIFEYEQLWLVR